MHGGLELDNCRLKMEIQSREMRVFSTGNEWKG